MLAVFLIPLISALGAVVTVGGLSAARPLAVVLLLATVLAVRQVKVGGMLVAAASVGWLAWGFMTLSISSHLRDLIGLACGLATALAFALIPWDRSRLRVLVWGWCLAWVVAVLPGIYETVTGAHLPNYLESSPDYVRESVTDTASFFVNPNPYAVFLCISMVVLAVGARLEKGWVAKLMLAASLAGPVLIYPTNSRITQLVSILVAAWVIWSIEAVRARLARLAAAGAVVVCSGLVAVLLTPGVQGSIARLVAGSGEMRINLYESALWMFVSTGGAGVGPGMFEPTIQSGLVPYDTGSAINPHSGVFEIVSEYGSAVAALAIVTIIVLLRVGLPGFTRRFRDPADALVRQGVVVFAVAMPALSFGDSTFLDSPIVWAGIASTFALAHFAHGRAGGPLPRWVAAGEPSLPRKLRILRRQVAGSSRA